MSNHDPQGQEDLAPALIDATRLIDPMTFRHVLGHFASGIVVVTAMLGDAPVGMTAQSFTSLSLEPPLVMFCAAKVSSSWPKIRAAGHFAANILSSGQEDLGRQFARPGIDKFAGVDWVLGPSGAPLLTGVLAHIDCRIRDVYDGGDHEIVVGEVLHLAANAELEPLLFFRSDFGNFLPSAAVSP